MNNLMYSVVIPTYNNLHYLCQTINSVFLHTQDFEIIVIDNGSKDGTVGYLKDVKQRVEPTENFTIITNDVNVGFAPAINQGIEVAKAPYVIILNNDVIVTPQWADFMIKAKETLEHASQIGPYGIIGPASNYVAGRQSVPNIRYRLEDLDNVAMKFHNANKHNYMVTGYLSGFCVLVDRQVFNEIGLFDPQFAPGGYEDNDFVVRANRAGWKAIIAGDVFVHHFGSRTLDMVEFKHLRRGVANRSKFYGKWKEIDKVGEDNKKLVAIYRVKNEASREYFRWSLEKTCTFADEIVVLCDNCTDNTAAVALEYNSKKCPVHIIEKTDGIFNERDDRNCLIEEAKKLNADWIIAIDADEVFEDKFDREYVIKLMNPRNPEVCCYGFHWMTFFEGTTHWRVDGIFGRVRGWRMFRNIPGDKAQKIVLGTEIGLHNGNIPSFPPENCRWTSIRIKHYGYESPAQCQTKRTFYEGIDKDKQKALIGAEDYAHLTPSRLSLMKWKDRNTLSFAVMVSKVEEADLLGDLLEQWYYLADEVVIVITNLSNAESVERVAHLYTDNVYYFEWCDDFSKARNFLVSKCTCDWIMTMDPDEAFTEYGNLHVVKMIELDTDGFMFKVRNTQKDGVFSISEAVRLFCNNGKFTYSGRVHENFDELLWDKRVTIMQSPIAIEHYGYLKSDDEVEQKLQYYEKLNRLQMRDHPKDCRPYFNLALHYRNEGNIERAKSLLLQAIKLNPKFLNAIKELGFMLAREGTEWFKHGMEIIPEGNANAIEMMKQLVDGMEGVIGKEELYVGKARAKRMQHVSIAKGATREFKNIVEGIATPGVDKGNVTRMSLIGAGYQTEV